ncbi:hypothetical protein [Hyalangium rubrum]|uniref:Lipoprotein n=1 Tax=Hyalangium rubrum TaxID=3103134 RepID=A0ABU5H9R9_9BACT|nr:hypothetical protein [Hyalangium sp. s54d21]MDY7230237.1 hypothetical protein [Hyalangium sp. s54d21]
MGRLRQWTAIALAVGLCGWGYACQSGDEEPSGYEREARSEVLRGLLARERVPTPEELDAQGRDLRAEVGEGEAPGQGGSGREAPTARAQGKVEWVGDDELLFWDEAGAEQEVRIEPDTRFVRKGQEVSRRTVEAGAEIQVSYEVHQGEWIAREVIVLRPPPPADSISRPP